MHQCLVAQLQQLVAGLLEHHGAVHPFADHDRRGGEQQELLAAARAQPLRRRMTGKRGGDAGARDPVGRRLLAAATRRCPR